MQRMTKQRQAVFAELARVPDFRSAQQIFDALKAHGDKVGLATVYRNLQTLAEDERVDVLRSHDGEALYRLCGSAHQHHHLVCRECGRAEEIEQDAIEAWVNEVGAAHGFSDVEHSMELFGLCDTCAKDM